MKVIGTIVVVVVLLGGLVIGGVYAAWNKWGGNLADENESLRSGLTERPVVASATIQADQGIYDSYSKREDVLVMVEYYSDT